MKIQQANDTKVKLADSSLSVSRNEFEATDNPIIKKVKETSINLTATDKMRLSVNNFLSKREAARWKRLPQSKQQRVIKRFEKKNVFKQFTTTLEKNNEMLDMQKESVMSKRWDMGSNRKELKDTRNARIEEYPYYDKPPTEQFVNDSNCSNKRRKQNGSGSLCSHNNEIHKSSSKIYQKTIQENAGKMTAATAESAYSVSASASVAASTGGTSEAAKASVKAVKKFADEIKKTVGNDNAAKDSPENYTELHGSNLTISNEHMSIVQNLTAIFAMVIAFVAQTIGMLLLPIILIITIITIVVTVVVSIFSAVASMLDIQATVSNTINMLLSEATQAYYDEVNEAAIENDIEGYTDYLMAIIEVESHGEGQDIMQSCESAGADEDSFSSSDSIAQGTSYFAECLSLSFESGCDVETAVQAYNFGTGFIDYVADRGCKYTFELAVSYAEEKSNGVKVDYANEIAVNENGGWRYLYGNMFYVKLVEQYVTVYDNETVRTVIQEAKKYEGMDYVYGGSDPDTGFDCSGLVQWCYGQAGIDLPRTAQEQYDSCTHLTMEDAQAGDLIFFTNTTDSDNYITHVGIYLGDGKIFEAGDPLGIYDMTNEWHTSHYVCCGRVIDSLNDEENVEVND